MASAVAYCHDGTNIGYRTPGWQAMIHSDIKQSNIFVFDPNEKENKLYPHLKLADLGHTITVPTKAVSQYWVQWAIRHGTQSYLPPEDHARSKVYDDRTLTAQEKVDLYTEPMYPTTGTDIWTLGVTIRQFISLIHKFIPRRLYEKLVRERLKRPFYSPALNRLVEQCLHKDPTKRPTAHQVYMLTRHYYAIHRKELFEQWEYARSKGKDVYLGQILFTEADKKRFKKDRAFRAAYWEANRGSLRDWLGVPRQEWQALDPDHDKDADPKGPERADLKVDHPMEQLDPDPKENARRVLEKEATNQWLADYYEAAGNLSRPRAKPDPVPPPDSPTVDVLNATWQNAQKPKQSHVDNAWKFFQEYHFQHWNDRMYDLGDFYGGDSHYKATDDTINNDDDDDDSSHGKSTTKSNGSDRASQISTTRDNAGAAGGGHQGGDDNDGGEYGDETDDDDDDYGGLENRNGPTDAADRSNSANDNEARGRARGSTFSENVRAHVEERYKLRRRRSR